MANTLPPAPTTAPPGSYAWTDWYNKLQSYLSATTVTWTNLDKTGSNLADLVTRQHNVLQGIQGGAAADYQHLTTAQLAVLTGATNLNTASTVVKRDASGNFSAGNITANLTGNVTGNLTGAVTGNASTATKLFTARLINGVSFDGSADITFTSFNNISIGATTPSTGNFTTFSIKSGANTKIGTATLVAGTVTVSNTSVTTNSKIFLTSQVDGGTPGWLRVSARVAGTSFTITSSSATDTSTVAYLIVEPS